MILECSPYQITIRTTAEVVAGVQLDVDKFLARDPETFEKLLYILGGPTEWLTDYLIPNDPERDEDIKQMAREGAQFVADYLDSLEQKVQNGSLDREEAIALAAAATLTILKLTPKSKRAALLKKLNAPIKRLTARFKVPDKGFTPSQRQTEVAQLFDRTSPRSGIQIGNRTVLNDATNKGGAKVFSGVSDAEVKGYFSQLTGQSFPASPTTIVPGKGNIYTIETPSGNFNLRDFSSSTLPNGRIPRWTIDVPGSAIGQSKPKFELKFE